jgi:hypothetical protein
MSRCPAINNLSRGMPNRVRDVGEVEYRGLIGQESIHWEVCIGVFFSVIHDCQKETQHIA